MNPLLAAGGAAVALVAAVIFLVHVADSNPPPRAETRIELPNAFSQ